MDLDEAYRILEVDPGADEDTVREARKTLAKVWHPDRHANDPALQKKAQDKLADVNAAFEVVDTAGFPRAKTKAPPPEPKPPPAAPVVPPAPPPRVDDFAPPRRIRWSVILVLAAALGVGAYLAITKLGSSTAPRDAAVALVVDAAAPDVAVVVAEDAAVPVVADAPEVPTATVRRERTFTLGSTREDVIAAMGQPQGTSSNNTIINGVRTSSAQLAYGESSTIDFDGNDKVIGWTEGDSPLHVRLDVRDAAMAAAAKARGTFAIGAPTDEVLGILGPPTSYTKARWAYGTSTLELERGRVVRITQGEPKLPVTP